MSDTDIKYILPVSQYQTADTLNPVTSVALSSNVGLTGFNTTLSAMKLSDEDKAQIEKDKAQIEKDKIKKIAIYSVSGIAVIIAIILLVKTLRK